MLRKSLVPCVAIAALALLVDVQVANAQGRRGGGGGGGMMRGPQGVNDIFVAGQDAAQKEVGIKPDQKEKLHDLSQDVREEVMQAIQASGVSFPGGPGAADLSPEERQKKMAEFTTKMAEVSKTVNEKFAPKLAEILDKTQAKRIHELAIQLAGAQALLDAGVQKDLNVTADQKEKLASINKDFQKQLAEVPRAERQTKMHELNEEQLAKSTEVLTKDQQTQFASLKGKAFDTKLLRPQGGGRRMRANAGGQ
jgi:hypothetical protein